jgi:hypothetical protein
MRGGPATCSRASEPSAALRNSSGSSSSIAAGLKCGYPWSRERLAVARIIKGDDSLVVCLGLVLSSLLRILPAFLCGVRNDDAGSGSFLCFDAADQHTIMEGPERGHADLSFSKLRLLCAWARATRLHDHDPGLPPRSQGRIDRLLRQLLAGLLTFQEIANCIHHRRMGLYRPLPSWRDWLASLGPLICRRESGNDLLLHVLCPRFALVMRW